MALLRQSLIAFRVIKPDMVGVRIEHELAGILDGNSRSSFGISLTSAFVLGGFPRAGRTGHYDVFLAVTALRTNSS